MTLMAQRILEAEIDLNHSDQYAVSVLLDARRFIAGGFSPNHLCGTMADVDMVVKVAEQSARIYKFDAAIVCHVADLLRSEECLNAALAQSKLPFDVVFYEWSEEGFDWGVLQRKTEGGQEEGIIFYAVKGGAPLPVVAFKRSSGSRHRYVETFEYSSFDGVSDEDLNHVIQWMTGRPILLTSLLNIHGFVETSENRWPDKLQAARQKRGRLPLLSFNNVTLRIPKKHPQRHIAESIAEFGVRYHERSGHFKAPFRKRGPRQVVWVPSYWAGNRERGVVLKIRNVSSGK